jgi:hypothetical protein
MGCSEHANLRFKKNEGSISIPETNIESIDPAPIVVPSRSTEHADVPKIAWDASRGTRSVVFVARRQRFEPSVRREGMLFFVEPHKSTSQVALEIFLSHGVVHPRSFVKISWDLFIAGLIVYSVITVPFRLGYGITIVTGSTADHVDIAIDSVFALDILISFRTTVANEEGAFLLSGWAIAFQYIKGWFAVDFLSTVPFDRFAKAFASETSSASSTARATKLLKTLRLVRLLKLLRLLKLKRVLGAHAEGVLIPPVVMDLVKNMMLLGFFSHIMSCVWYHVGLDGLSYIEDDAGLNRTFVSRPIDSDPDSWIERYAPGPRAKQFVLRNRLNRMDDQYVASLYWVFATFLGVGYGDISATPSSRAEIVVCILGMSLGTIVFAMFVAAVVNVVDEVVSHNGANDAVMRVKDWLLDRGVPEPRVRLVRRALKAQLATRSVDLDELAISKYMPTFLLDEVVKRGYRKFPWRAQGNVEMELSSVHGRGVELQDNHVLSEVEAHFPGAVSQIVLRLESLSAWPGDLIVECGEMDTALYVLTSGKLTVNRPLTGPRSTSSAMDLSPDSRSEKMMPVDQNSVVDAQTMVATLRSGDWFGQWGLVVPRGECWNYRVNIEAESRCELSFLSRAKWDELCDICPDLTRAFVDLLGPESDFNRWIKVAGTSCDNKTENNQTFFDSTIVGKLDSGYKGPVIPSLLTPMELRQRIEQTSASFEEMGTAMQLLTLDIGRLCPRIGAEAIRTPGRVHVGDPGRVSKRRRLSALY